MAKKTYVAKTPINYSGEPFAEGDPIELDDKTEAPALLAVGAIAPAEPVKTAAAKK